MSIDTAELDRIQTQYIQALEQWIAALHYEKALASGNHDEAEIDKWEAAGFQEEAAREKATTAKKNYENALREKFFNF